MCSEQLLDLSLEGLKERMVWLGLNTETDPFGQKMMEVIWNSEAGDTMDRLLADAEFEFAGVTMGAFDLTENKDSLEVLCICNNLAYATPVSQLPTHRPVQAWLFDWMLPRPPFSPSHTRIPLSYVGGDEGVLRGGAAGRGSAGRGRGGRGGGQS